MNDERGLEQGFTLFNPPESSNPVNFQITNTLILEMELTGNLKASLNSSGDAIEFSTPAGVCMIRYANLYAYDAKGRTLPTRFELRGNIVSIQVDSNGAAWPITVDPLATSPGWTGESNQAGANFGKSVATAGDVNGDGFSDVIVGAWYFDGGESYEGKAFVYYGSATGLNTTASWSAEGNQANANFGVSVGTAGDVNGDGYADVIVGASGFDSPEIDGGKTFVYYGSATGLNTVEDWTENGGQAHILAVQWVQQET